jgi:hypothetical protein
LPIEDVQGGQLRGRDEPWFARAASKKVSASPSFSRDI